MGYVSIRRSLSDGAILKTEKPWDEASYIFVSTCRSAAGRSVDAGFIRFILLALKRGALLTVSILQFSSRDLVRRRRCKAPEGTPI